MADRKIIESLQGWRAIMMVVVVTAHLFGLNILYGGAGEAMPFFFILSGFVLTIVYYERFNSNGLSEVKSFMKKRIAKIYPLYIFSVLLAFFYYEAVCFISKDTGAALEHIKYFITDALLIQAWIPLHDYYMSLNGVAWFVSSLMFSYLLFLPTLKLVKRFDRNKSLFACLVLVFVLSAWEICSKKTFNLPEYYTYVFPIYRYFDFAIGMLIAKCFLLKEQKTERKTIFTFFEILIVLAFVFERLFAGKFASNKLFYLIHPILQLITMILLISVFSYGRGFVSKLISNKLFLLFASISFEVYMVHQVFQNILGTICNKLGIISLTGIFTVVSTIIFAIVWKRFEKFINNRKKKVKM